MVRKTRVMRVSSIFDSALEDYMKKVNNDLGVSLSKPQTTEIFGKFIKNGGLKKPIKKVRKVGRKKKSYLRI